MTMPTTHQPTNSGEVIRLLIVDDHASYRQALAMYFALMPDLEVIGEAGSLMEGRALIASGIVPNLTLLDLQLPDGHGSDLLRDLRRAHSASLALVVTGSEDVRDHARALVAGAAHVLPKSSSLPELLETIRRLWGGEVFPPTAELVAEMQRLDEEQSQRPYAAEIVARLTGRERDLLDALGQGLGDKEIAARHYVSERTVRNQMSTLLNKLGVNSRIQALIFAIRHGIITLR